MKKRVLAVLLVACMILSLAACKKDDGSNNGSTTTTQAPAETKTDDKGNEVAATTPAPTDVPVEAATDVDEINDISSGELVDGKFAETRHIRVELFDRAAVEDVTSNIYADFVKKGMLEKYNVEVEFVPVSRWSEGDELNTLLAASNAPDICYTYDLATINQYATYGGVLDISEYLTDDYKPLFANLWNWLGSANILQNQNPSTGEVYCIEGKRNNTYRINTFVRADWLKKLGMEAPKTTAEFEAMLVAFRDNAELLLGADADKMIPFAITSDVGWTAANLIESKMDPDITDKELYVNGFDDRKFTENGTKEAVRILNKWFNDGLIWKDFALSASGDTTIDDLMKAGFVGAFLQNYDYPFRNNEDSINCNIQTATGDPDAGFIAVNCFEDKNGGYNKYSYSAAGDRKAFLPATNKEPLASMLYLDFISTQEVIQFLQLGGEEGVTYEVKPDGAYALLSLDEAHTMMGGNNIDITMTCNGLRLASDDLTALSLAYGYAGNDPAIVADAMAAAAVDAQMPKTASVGAIESEGEYGAALAAIRDSAYDKAVGCAVADFDTVWDQGMSEYLSAGGQEIMDERLAAWEATYGTATMLP